MPERRFTPSIVLSRLSLALLLVAACVSGGSSGERAAPRGVPVRVILFIADGAGLAHWSAGYLAAAETGQSLAVASFPVVGLVDPANVSRLKPESASGATAIATGVRTYYEGVGVGPDSLPRTSIFEAAKAAGLATGVITTTFLVDATPAAFLAHVPGRRSMADKASIAAQIAHKNVEVLMGDGRGWFDGTQRPDSLDLLEGMRSRYTVVESGAELRALDPDTVEALLGLFDTDVIRDPASRDPSLAEMTRAALAVLDRDPAGFFLLVENEHIDHATHENLSLAVLAAELLSLDAAVEIALEYARDRPETLILVTADHETGGLSLVPTLLEGVETLEARFGWTDHTLTLVPLFAIGPGAEGFGGILRNDEIGRLLLETVAASTRPVRGPAPDHE